MVDAHLSHTKVHLLSCCLLVFSLPWLPPTILFRIMGPDVVNLRLDSIRGAKLESTVYKAGFGPGACDRLQVHLSHNMIGAAGAAALVRAVPAPPLPLLRGAAAKGHRRQGPCGPGGPGGLWLRLEWNQIPVGSAAPCLLAMRRCQQCVSSVKCAGAGYLVSSLTHATVCCSWRGSTPCCGTSGNAAASWWTSRSSGPLHLGGTRRRSCLLVTSQPAGARPFSQSQASPYSSLKRLVPEHFLNFNTVHPLFAGGPAHVCCPWTWCQREAPAAAPLLLELRKLASDRATAAAAAPEPAVSPPSSAQPTGATAAPPPPARLAAPAGGGPLLLLPDTSALLAMLGCRVGHSAAPCPLPLQRLQVGP
jgi:hypothetical protein